MKTEAKSMSPEEQRIAIAEACGWSYDDYYEQSSITKGRWSRVRKDGSTAFAAHPLDYLNDLNAIHSAVAGMEDWQQVAFAAALSFEAGLQGKFTHQLKALDWANCFLLALQSERVSIKSTP